ncbi:MAG: M24 family metallopeptidase [bacterium]|nr:M24 family metallopeptidase [bacterium]
MTDVELFRVRIALIQAFLMDNGYDGILLSRIDNYAMATGGKRNFVYTAGDMGSNALFVAKDGNSYLVANSIEEPRQVAEEVGPLVSESMGFLWFDDTPAGAVKKAFSGTLVSDDGSLGANVNGELAYLRSLLTTAELDKFRRLGALAADALTTVVNATEAGMAEADISAMIAAEGAKRRCLTPITLVAADERIARFRHPVPTVAPLLDGPMEERAVRGYVMIVGSFIREGLVASVTRFKKVGDIDAAIPDAFNRICAVDAILQEQTQPGRTLGDVFADCQQAYVDFGFPENEWHNHHQGGATGYAGRTCKAAPGEAFPILEEGWSKRVKEIAGVDAEFGHAFAWNPSGVGVKSEDTFILLPDGSTEIVTATPSLPTVDLNGVLGRPTDIVKSGIAGA